MKQPFYQKKRRDLGNLLPEKSVAVIPAGKEVASSLDDCYPFYANNNYFYLTGIREPEGLLVIQKDEGELTETLYIRKPDYDREKWIGRYITTARASEVSGIGDIRYIDDFSPDSLLCGNQLIYFDQTIPDHQKPSYAENCDDLTPFLVRLRLIKEPEEIEMMQNAISITAKGIDALCDITVPGVKEYELAALFEYMIKDGGADGTAFATIAASGQNAPILHYVENKDTVPENAMVLFDLGAKVQGYAADISRTLPAGGKFSDDAAKLYNAVLTAQELIIDAYRVGASMKDIQAYSREILWEQGLKTGLFAVGAEIDDYYYHGIGHSLGLDTHDLCLDRNLTLAPGMVITCEPGLYLAHRGMGVRIEDDILITEDGPVNLSVGIPKTIEDIERRMR